LRIHENVPITFVISVRLSARIVPPPAGRIFTKFDIEVFYEYLSR